MSSRSGKARVLSNTAKIFVRDNILQLDVLIGEVDSFSASSTSEIRKSRPIGATVETAYLKYGGYDITMRGGKVDWQLAARIHGQDLTLRTLGVAPSFNIYQKIEFYDGSIEEYEYTDSLIFGYNIDITSGSEVTEEIKGFCATRNTPIVTLGSGAPFGNGNAIATTVISVVSSVVAGLLKETANSAVETGLDRI